MGAILAKGCEDKVRKRSRGANVLGVRVKVGKRDGPCGEIELARMTDRAYNAGLT